MDTLFISFETVVDWQNFDPDDEQTAVEPVFSTLAASLERHGAEFVGEPSEWNAYGWYVDVAVGTTTLTCMLQRSDHWLLQIISHRTLMDRFKGRYYDAELRSLAALVSEAVEDAFGVPRPAVQTEAEFNAR